MADYLQTLRMRNMFPGTEAPPPNFGGDGYMPNADQYGMDMPSQGGYGGNMFQPIQNEYMPPPTMNAYGVDEGYGNMFTGPMQGPETSDYNIDQRMNQLYDPQHEQGDRLNTLLSGYPERPLPQTGWRGALQKIGAVAGGMTGGMNLYNEVMAPGYSNKVADWKGQTGPTQQAAQIERQNNVNERQSAMGVISAELRNQAMQHKAKNDEVRAQIAQQRADTYDDKQRNPHFKFQFPVTGNMMIMNPATGEITDSGRPVSSFSKADQMALAQTHALERIQETGAQGRETAVLRGEIESGHIDERGDQSRITKGTPSGTLTPGGNKPEQPTQTRVKQVLKAREIFNSRPELAKFIEIDGNDFKITPPSTGGMFSSGPTPEQHAEINRIIYGSPDTDRRAGAMVKMITPDGRTVNVPAGKVEEATRKGAKKAL